VDNLGVLTVLNGSLPYTHTHTHRPNIVKYLLYATTDVPTEDVPVRSETCRRVVRF
jgi:hypothetical protein